MSTDEGDIVLDPFVGTGTAAIAAKKMGRKFIGIDIDSKYVDITIQKLEETEPTKINGCYVSFFLDRVVTARDVDWKKIKEAFYIPNDPIELEKREICLLQKSKSLQKPRSAENVQKNLFPIIEECE